MIPYPEINPVFLKIGPLAFRWYGLMYALSFGLSYLLVGATAARRKIVLHAEALSDLIFYAAMGIILGGRIGYILFYNPAFYFANPLKLLAVWEGGMSFHGGCLGGLIGGLIFCRKMKRSFLEIADIAMPSVAVGLGLGRIGNFINGELFGRETDVPWCMVFPDGGDICRHPSQLYQAALEGGALFLILWFLSKKDWATGSLLGMFLLAYGAFRFSVEFFRQPDAHIGFIFGFFSMGQLLSLPMCVIGLAMLIVLNRKKKGVPSHGS